MTRPKKAAHSRPGDHLRPQILTDTQLKVPHIVMNVQFTPDMKVSITTNCGTWLFDQDEEMNFPRRPDGSTRDWANGAATPEDLAVGDTLPGENGEEEIRREITSITRSGIRYRVGISRVQSYVFRYDFTPGEAITFPRESFSSSSRAEAFDPRKLEVFGAYGDYDERGRWWWLFAAKHPTGHGRWPRIFSPLWRGYSGFSIQENVLVIRPPGSAWPHFYGDRGDRHPNDLQLFIATPPDTPPTVEDARSFLSAL